VELEYLGPTPHNIGMAYIDYVAAEEWDLDPDNILRIHGINPPVLQAHYDLYRATMYAPSP